MPWTVIARGPRASGPALPLALGLTMLCATTAAAQVGFPAPSSPAAAAAPAPPAAVPGGPPAVARNPVCLNLEAQLASVERGTVDPAAADQIKRNEDLAAKQQADLDRLGQQSQRLGCQGAGFFALFSGQSPQCGPLNNQIQQVRSNINYYQTEIQRLQGNSGQREGQRRSVLTSLAQNDCGPQYRQYANAGPSGFFETLFGINPVPSAPTSPMGVPLSGTYRTLCVRTCDGYYFPISYSTIPGKFAEDEALCHRLCPAAEVALFSHRNPGEDVSQAVSTAGKPYTQLPTAFSYRKTYNAACSCRAPGQSWAEALRGADDQILERGDIVVTEERAKQLSQPRFDAQGKPVTLDAAATSRPAAARDANAPAKPGQSNPVAAAAAATVGGADNADADPSKRKIRAVGPAFLPAR